MKERIITLLLCLFLGIGLATAQTTRVTGTITSVEGNEPVVGASLIIKGTSVGTITDADGAFSLEAPSDAKTLVVSYLGMKTQELSISPAMRIVMHPDMQRLGEVVVTALGLSREKKALGYAMQEIEGDEMTRARQANAISMLQGKVAGLQITSVGGSIGGSSRVVMRGVKSVLGNNQPLYVIDGIPLDNSDMTSVSSAGGTGGVAGVSKDFGNMAQDINPDDIESISVLKGASASALYGSRAANGVILVTTKKGAKGKGVEVSVTSGVSFENMLERNMPAMQKLYGGGEDFIPMTIDGKSYQTIAYWVDESWGPKYDGQMVLSWENLYPEDTGRYLKETEWKYPDNDIMYFFRQGYVFDNNIQLSGGGENTTFRVSYTNKTAQGIIPNSKLQRNTLSATGSVTWEKLTIDASLNYISNYVKGRPWTGTTNRNVINQAYQWGMTSVDYKEMENYRRPDGSQRTWNVTAWNNLTPRFIDNPYWAAYMSYSEEQRDRTYGSVGATYSILDWLTASVKVNGDVYTYGIEDRIAMHSRSTSDYSEEIHRFREMNYEAMISANKVFNDFSLQAFVGGNIMIRDTRYSLSRALGGLVIPEYYNFRNAKDGVETTNDRYKKQVNSLFGSTSLGWKSFLYMDATLRIDASSTLPSNNRTYFYPSVTGSFVFSDSPWMEGANWLTFGKLRLGWAQVGNDTEPYALEKYYSSTNSSFGGIANFELPSTLNNSSLKPERTNSWEIGLDMRVLNNRLGLDFTYYDNLSKNQIMKVDIAPSGGYTNKYFNAGSVMNRGVEIAVTGVPVRTGDFEWTAIVNWSKNKNEVKELYEGIQSLQIASSLMPLYAVVGKPYGMLSGTNYVYDDNGNKVVNSTGTTAGTYAATEQPEFLGSVLPDWLMGIRNELTYKNFSLGFLVDVRKGGKFFSQTYKYGTYSGTLKHTAENGIRENGLVLDGVTGTVTYNADGTYTVSGVSPNTINVPARTWARSMSSSSSPAAQNVFDADFVKLREISASYTFDTANWKFAKSLKLSAFAYNVWTIWKANDYIDPDFTSSSGNIQGIEGAIVPAPVTYGMSVNIKF